MPYVFYNLQKSMRLNFQLGFFCEIPYNFDRWQIGYICTINPHDLSGAVVSNADS
jgi:hypothetical protein